MDQRTDGWTKPLIELRLTYESVTNVEQCSLRNQRRIEIEMQKSRKSVRLSAEHVAPPPLHCLLRCNSERGKEYRPQFDHGGGGLSVEAECYGLSLGAKIWLFLV